MRNLTEKRSWLVSRLGRVVAIVSCLGMLALPAPVFCQPEGAQNLMLGKVIKIYDGDTIAINDDKGKMVRVQLAYIDAPDMDDKTGERQPFFGDSIKTLSGMIFNKEVIVEFFGTDKTGKIEGMIFLDKLNVNAEMVRLGMAEIYEPVRSRPSSFNQNYVKELLSAEEAAKSEKLGIWGDPGYISPYKFRRRASQ